MGIKETVCIHHMQITVSHLIKPTWQSFPSPFGSYQVNAENENSRNCRWKETPKHNRKLLQRLFFHLSQHSLWQRRELRGDVRPWQPPEWGHPAQFSQHLQRGQLLLRDPSCLRPVNRHHHHIKPEHRGEPAAEGRHPVASVRELIVLKFARGPVLERCCLPILSDRQRGGILSQLQFGPHST